MDAHDGSVTAAATTVTTSTAVGHAAMDVLGNHVLWDQLTGFMRGYPLVVSTFLRECTRGFMASAMRRLTQKSRANKYLSGSLMSRGLLPNLAIAANDLHMLKVLLRLGKKPQYRRDQQLSFAGVHHCAVAFNRAEILTFVCRLRGPGGSELHWKWGSWLMRLALERSDPDLRVLDQLLQKLPQGSYLLLERDLLRHTKRGDFEVVRWLHQHGCVIYQIAVDAAAAAGELDILRYFYEHSDKRCEDWTAIRAAESGALEVVKLILENTPQSSIMYRRLAIAAAEHGQLEVVKYFIEGAMPLRKSDLINYAAWGGHLPVVKYLYGKYADIISAANGHRNNNANFSTSHHRFKIWVEEAINFAGTGGQVEVVKFLYLNDAQGCRPSLGNALRYGAGRFEVVDFLCEQQQQQEFERDAVMSALICAVPYGDLRTLALLLRKLHVVGESAYPALREAVLYSQPKSVEYLCENQDLEQQPMSFLTQAVVEANDELVRAVGQYASVEELRQATEFALELSQPRIVDTLLQIAAVQF